MEAYFDWEAGNLTAQQALHALLSELSETENEIAALNTQREGLRGAIGVIVAREGNQQIGDTKVLLAAPSVVISYDRKVLAELALKLTATHPELAAELARCRRAATRAGSLRIEKAR